jgi:hypothetical protein
MKGRGQTVTRKESKKKAREQNQGNGREHDLKEMERNMGRGKA